jgi:hypothetical protein
LNHSTIHTVVPRRVLFKKDAQLPELEPLLWLNEGEFSDQFQLVNRHKQVQALASIQNHESALLARVHRAERASVEAPDGATGAAGLERVVNSLVGLGFLRCSNGKGVDSLDGLHGLDGFALLSDGFSLRLP